MEFRILGPLEVHVEGRALALGGVKPRALLAVLLLSANESVSAERLALAFGARTPRRRGQDRAGPRLAVAQGARRLGPAGDEGRRLPARGAAPGSSTQSASSAPAEGRRTRPTAAPSAGGERLRGALGLWRARRSATSPSLAFARAEIARLEEQRLAALEARVEADLAAGGTPSWSAELAAARAARTVAGAAARPADARALPQRPPGGRAGRLPGARARVAEELGLEPGEELRDSSRRMLAHDPGARRPRAARARPPRPRRPGRAQGAPHDGASRRRARSSSPSSSRPRSRSGAEPTRRSR